MTLIILFLLILLISMDTHGTYPDRDDRRFWTDKDDYGR